jgi:hypothetical protein
MATRRRLLCHDVIDGRLERRRRRSSAAAQTFIGLHLINTRRRRAPARQRRAAGDVIAER